MLLLTKPTDIVRLITGNAVSTLTVHCSYIDHSSGAFTPGSSEFNISTADTTTIVSSPVLGTQRNVKSIFITNNSVSSNCTITVQLYNGTIASDLMAVTLLPGENCILNSEGDWTHHDSQGGVYVGRSQSDISSNGYAIAGTIAENMSRIYFTEANITPLTSGTLFLVAIYLIAGQRINYISFLSGATAAVSPTNQFFSIYDINRSLLAQTANDLTAAIQPNTLLTKQLTSTFIVTYTGIHYIGIVVSASTVPSLRGVSKSTNTLNVIPPVLHGNSSSGLTNILPNPAAALSVSTSTPWVSVS